MELEKRFAVNKRVYHFITCKMWFCLSFFGLAVYFINFIFYFYAEYRFGNEDGKDDAEHSQGVCGGIAH